MTRKILALILALTFMLAAAGCKNETAPSAPSDKPAAAGEKTDKEKKSEKKMVEFTLWRVPKNGGPQLVAERIKTDDTGKDRALAALEALVYTKPLSDKLVNLFPEGTKVLGVKVKDGVADVDFNAAFAKKTQGSYNELMMVNQVVATLTELDGIKKVRFLVEGREIDTIGGHMDLIDPLERDKDLLSKQ